MKKFISLILAIVMCFSLCAPAFAQDSIDIEVAEFILDGSQEIWHPANGVMPLEDMDGCMKGHRPPAGFVYQGYYTGNTVVDTIVQSGIVQLMSYIPGIGLIVSIIDSTLTIEWLSHYAEEGRLRTNYDKYTYTNANGVTYYHIIWWYRADDGLYRQLACEVQTSGI